MPCSRMQAMVLRLAPRTSQISMSMLTTRFKRLAQVIAMEGMYAGFAGAKTGHGGATLGGCRGIVGSRRSVAAASGRDLDAQRAIRRKDAVVADEVNAGFGVSATAPALLYLLHPCSRVPRGGPSDRAARRTPGWCHPGQGVLSAYRTQPCEVSDRRCWESAGRVM